MIPQSNPSHHAESQPVFDVFIIVFIENQAWPEFTGTEKGIPLTTENVFLTQVQQMYPTARKVSISVLRPANNHRLLAIPDWVQKKHFLFPKGKKFIVRSTGPSPEFPKVVEFNGVKHRLPRKKKKVSRTAMELRAKGKKKASRATVQKRAKSKPKATRKQSARRKGKK